MQSDFSKLMKYIKDMQSRYHRALAAFHVYETLMQLTAPNHVGQEEAEKNSEIMGTFRNFFIPIRETTRVYFFLELAKMFDTSTEALQINKILAFTASRRKKLTAEDFAAHNSDRQLVEQLITEYKGISEEDIEELRGMLTAHQTTIDNLITYRNKWLAHDDIKKEEPPSITGEEIIALFEMLEKIMNTLGSRLNSERWMWDHVKRDSEWQTKLVVEHLRRFEPYRLKEIEAEMQVEIEKHRTSQLSTPDTLSNMKIISLNTWAGVVIEPLLEFFERNRDIDVFCLQEIYSKAEGKTEPHPELDMKLDLFERIEERLKNTHIGYFRPAHKDYYGQAIFVKNDIPVNEEGDIFIYENKDPEGRGRHSRNLQYIRTEVNGKPTVIANLHGLWNGMGKTDTDDRLEQGRRIRDFIARCSEQVIVVGDFNLNPDTQSLALAEEGMRNLIKEYGITSTRTSFYTKEEKFADYALVSPHVNVVSFSVLPDEVSDHAALLLEIK